MLVMKFGGTSVKNADKIRTVLGLVRQNMHRRPVVVCSAHGGVTDKLIDLAQSALQGQDKFRNIVELHYRILENLGLEKEIIKQELDELHELIRGIKLVKELTPRTKDYVMSFGERLSCATIAAFFRKEGLDAERILAYDLGFVTDSNFGSAGILPETPENIRAYLADYKKIPIITGFIAKNKKGDITTIGRNGSDYSASIVGAAIGAEEIQIWTDVDGVMTCDPSIIQNALFIPEMSFDEASELAYFGADVLHPAAIQPAVEQDIPVRVLNTYKPDSRGTVVRSRPENPSPNLATAIAYKENQVLFNIVSSRMLLQHGFMQKFAEIFARYEVAIDMIATTEVSVSLTVRDESYLEEIVKELSFFSEVTVYKNRAVVCVVGDNIRRSVGVPGLVFDVLRKNKIPVEMISVGASKINISFVVQNDFIMPAVKSLHEAFFGAKPLTPADL